MQREETGEISPVTAWESDSEVRERKTGRCVSNAVREEPTNDKLNRQSGQLRSTS